MSVEHIKANLADCYCQQAKWEDADRVLSAMSDSRNKLDILAIHSRHAVSHIYFREADFDAADRTCRKALLGKKKLLGKTHDSYYHTVLLLACICSAKGDEVQGDGSRYFLPASLESRTHPVPLDHQLRPKTFRPCHLLKTSQDPAAQPAPEPATDHDVHNNHNKVCLEHRPKAILLRRLLTKCSRWDLPRSVANLSTSQLSMTRKRLQQSKELSPLQ